MISIKIIGDDEDRRQIEEISYAMLEYMGLEGIIEAAPAIPAGGDGKYAAYPVLLIDGRVACCGRIPRAGEVSTWLADAAMQT